MLEKKKNKESSNNRKIEVEQQGRIRKEKIIFEGVGNDARVPKWIQGKSSELKSTNQAISLSQQFSPVRVDIFFPL